MGWHWLHVGEASLGGNLLGMTVKCDGSVYHIDVDVRAELLTKKVRWALVMYLYLPDTPNTSRRVLRGVRAKMALIFSPNNQNITCKDVLIT